jgi:RNA polymerase sigma-70 factor, ECF subfamily
MPDHDDLVATGGVSTPHAKDPYRDPLTTFNRYRGLLFSIAYRMLGTVADAEDVLQEAYIRWHQASDEDIRSPKAFLITVISRLSINHLESAHLKREKYVGQWLPEPLVTGAGSDPAEIVRVDESLSMAFLVLLERLSPAERAVFLLREVFDHEYSEIAAVLDLTESNCRQILRRAKQRIRAARRRFQAFAPEHDDLLARFQQAARECDLDGLVALLAHNVVLHTDGGGKAPALPNLIFGAAHVARAILGSLRERVPKNLVQRLVHINGEPGFVSYLDGKPFAAFVMHASDGLVRSVYIVTNPEKLSRLPPPPC